MNVDYSQKVTKHSGEIQITVVPISFLLTTLFLLFLEYEPNFRRSISNNTHRSQLTSIVYTGIDRFRTYVLLHKLHCNVTRHIHCSLPCLLYISYFGLVCILLSMHSRCIYCLISETNWLHNSFSLVLHTSTLYL